VIRLFEEVKIGTRVKVRTLPESLAAEGPYMDDALGFATPNTVENEAKKAADLAAIEAAKIAKAEVAAKEAELAAKAREKADKKRLRECRRQKIDEALCPPLPPMEEPVAETGLENFKPAISAGPSASASTIAAQ
jgi:hypothetical protein